MNEPWTSRKEQIVFQKRSSRHRQKLSKILDDLFASTFGDLPDLVSPKIAYKTWLNRRCGF